MSYLERKAALKAAVTLKDITSATAARRMGVSYNHLMLVLKGDRHGSDRLRAAIAGMIGKPEQEIFGARALGNSR
jgi:lambda repressor-like predicted transcriptional regulator